MSHADQPIIFEPPLAIVEPDPLPPDPVVELLADTNRLLEQLLAQSRRPTSKVSLCVTDDKIVESTARNFPMRGSQRSIVRRTGNGGLFTVSTTVSVILPSEVTRLGGEIVNYGNSGAFIYCTGDTDINLNPLLMGIPVFWLSAAGGSWDFRLGDVLWCGHVSAQAQTGTTQLAAATI